MKTWNYRVKVGVVGCGAIGSRIVDSIKNDLRKNCVISGLYDIDDDKSLRLGTSLGISKKISQGSVETLIENADCVVEAINSQSTTNLVKRVILKKKTVLVMSVGKMLGQDNLFKLARRNKCYILLPSGALAGIDAIKAAGSVNIDKISLITRKPPKGLSGNQYFKDKNIDLMSIKKETVVFEGDVYEALKHFPQNINVAATLALASKRSDILRIKIVTSPRYTTNSHEVEVVGDFGRLVTKTENVACPDNPKTSYLAVLSGIQTLKQYCNGILIGT